MEQQTGWIPLPIVRKCKCRKSANARCGQRRKWDPCSLLLCNLTFSVCDRGKKKKVDEETEDTLGMSRDYQHHASPSLDFPGAFPIKVSNYSCWTLPTLVFAGTDICICRSHGDWPTAIQPQERTLKVSSGRDLKILHFHPILRDIKVDTCFDKKATFMLPNIPLMGLSWLIIFLCPQTPPKCPVLLDTHLTSTNYRALAFGRSHWRSLRGPTEKLAAIRAYHAARDDQDTTLICLRRLRAGRCNNWGPMQGRASQQLWDK